VSEKPAERGFHSLVAYQKSLVLFGGECGFDCFDDVWIFDTSRQSWELIKSISATGELPCARYQHDACILGNQMWVVGGKDFRGKVLDDIWSFDLTTHSWSLRGELPKPRSEHTLCVVKEKIFIIGGFSDDDDFNSVLVMDPQRLLLRNDGTLTSPVSPLLGPARRHDQIIYITNEVANSSSTGRRSSVSSGKRPTVEPTTEPLKRAEMDNGSEDEVKRLTKMMDEMKAKSELERVRLQIRVTELENSCHKAELAAKSNQNEQADKKVALERERYDKESNDMRQRYEKESNELCQRYDKELNELRRQLNEKQSTCDSQLSTLQTQYAALKRESDAWNKNGIELYTAITGTTLTFFSADHFHDLKKVYLDEKRRLADVSSTHRHEVSALKATIDDLKAEIKRLDLSRTPIVSPPPTPVPSNEDSDDSKRLITLQTQYELLESELQQQSQTISGYKLEIENYIAQIESLNRKLAEEQNHYKTEIRNASRLHADAFEKKEIEVERLIKSRRELEEKLSAQATELAVYKQELTNVEMKLKERTREQETSMEERKQTAEKLESDLKEREKAYLEKQQELEKIVDESKKIVERIHKENSSLRQQVEDLTQNQEQQRNSENGAAEKLKERIAALEAQCRDKDGVLSKLASVDSERHAIELECSKWKSETTESKKLVDKLRKELANIQTSAASLEADNKRLSDQLSGQNGSTQQLAVLEDRCRKLQRSESEAKKALEAAKQEIEQLKTSAAQQPIEVSAISGPPPPPPPPPASAGTPPPPPPPPAGCPAPPVKESSYIFLSYS
jgi:hypothetical protein